MSWRRHKALNEGSSRIAHDTWHLIDQLDRYGSTSLSNVVLKPAREMNNEFTKLLSTAQY
eukprot:scaffold106779_cov29-Prasinocladus_malaysianus.AAC.1